MKDIRRLRRSKGPRVLLEGPHLVGEALSEGLDLEAVLATPGFLESTQGQRLAEGLERPPLMIDPRLLDELCDSDSPRGVLAIGVLPKSDLAEIDLRQNGLYVFADGLQDPGNLGALARVAEAAGADALITGPGTCFVGHARALRASAGSLLRLPHATGIEAVELCRHLVDLSPTWATLSPRGGTSIYDLSWQETMVLVVGAEGPGVSEAALELTNLSVTIPMAGNVESLNATVSAAVVLFERQRCLAERRSAERYLAEGCLSAE